MPLPDPRYYHKLSPPTHRTHLALDVHSDARVNFGSMTPRGAYAGQLRRFAPAEDGGYRLRTVFGGPDLCAAATEGEEAEVHLSDAGETWTLERLPEPAPRAGRSAPASARGGAGRLPRPRGRGRVRMPVVAACSDAPATLAGRTLRRAEAAGKGPIRSSRRAAGASRSGRRLTSRFLQPFPALALPEGGARCRLPNHVLIY